MITIFSLNTFNSNNFKKNQSLISFIKKNEIHFLDEDSKKFLKEAFVFFNNEKCIFNFTTDISIPYFLKKKTCNKYFSPWLISGIVLENSYIRDLKKN